MLYSEKSAGRIGIFGIGQIDTIPARRKGPPPIEGPLFLFGRGRAPVPVELREIIVKIRSRWITRLVARVACAACRLLFLTVRIEYRLTVPGTNAFLPTPEKYLYCIWHESLLGPIFGGRHVCMAGLVSQHQDGSYLADAMKMDRRAVSAIRLYRLKLPKNEAAVLEAQNRAMAKAALAEAERREAEQRAEVEAPAKAQKARIIVEAEAEAEKRRIEAEGQAAAIFARLDAEARGQYEILAKKGEGLKQIIEACGGAKEAFQLLMLEHLDNLAEASAKAISNIKFDKVIVWENGGQNGKSNTASFLQNVAGSLPPMMHVLKDIGGVELPESLIKLNTEGLAGTKPATNGAAEPAAPRES